MAIFIETRGASLGPPRTHRNEFPAEYSLASCSPAALASAFPAKLILQPWSPFAKRNPANGSCRFYTLSHKRAQSIPHGSTLSNFQVIESKDASEDSAPVPKADSGLARKCPIFNGLCFNEMRAAC